MRTAKIVINGQEHLLCYNLTVIRESAARYGSAEGIYDALDSADEIESLNEAVWLLSRMMAAGKVYADFAGIPSAAPLSEQQLFDLCDINDFVGMKYAIIDAVTAGKLRHVETAAAGGNEEKN